VLVAAAVALAAALTACQGSARPLAASTATVHPATTTPASPGCARAAPAAGETIETIAVAGRARSYRLNVPAGTDGPRPLILLFHGSGSDAAVMSTYTGLPARAAARGYLVVTPDAVNHNWQVSLPTANTADLQLASALVASVSARFCVDPTRVYAAGFSLGSEFAAIAACAPGPPMAAIGLVSAEFLLKPCGRPVPVIAFHGTADPAVPYQNGAVGLSLPGIKVRGVENNLGDWAALDGCGAAPSLDTPVAGVARRIWPSCAAGDAVVLYTVLGGGHAWPGPPLDATGRILAFFAAHHT
jgi:polyhydroxybutyrate depolymerase